MEILYILIPFSVIFILAALAIFGWATKSGQFDDLEGPAHSILYDDDEDMIPGPKKQKQAQTEKPVSKDENV